MDKPREDEYKSEPIENKTDDTNQEEINKLQEKILNGCKYANFRLVKALIPKIQALLNQEKVTDLINQGMKKAHQGYMTDLSQRRLDLVEYLLAQGGSIPEKIDNSDLEYISKKYKEAAGNKTYQTIVNEYFEKHYAEAAKKAMVLFRKTIQDLSAHNGHELIKEEKLSLAAYGFYFSFDEEVIELHAFGDQSNKKLAEEKYSGLDVDSDLSIPYSRKAILPFLESMAEEGLFDSITTSGHIAIKIKYDNVLFARMVNSESYEKARQILEKQLVALEESENWTENEKTLRNVVCTYMVNRFDSDGSRCLKLLLRHLYCGEKSIESTTFQIMRECSEYSDIYYAPYRYEMAMNYGYHGFNWYHFEKDMKELVENYDYQPAKDRLAEWALEKPLLNYEIKDEGKKDQDEKDNNGGYTHKYTDEDLFQETDTMIARATHAGFIELRFKIEGRQGYSDALDFLNNLMTKGYSHFNDGYQLGVYFVAKPVIPKLSGYIPKVPELAFFTKAVMYEELHEKIRTFVMNTVKLYDHYHALDGEWSTVAGTFAAIAAFMHDSKFMDLAIHLAFQTDGEHEEIAAQMAANIKKNTG
ncbi:MAG: DUF6138 family protein [Bacteroides sp.]|nr:DUF6138 family protein [Bacteroides sp.]